MTPRLTQAVVQLAAEVRSFQRAELMLRRILGVELSAGTIRRLVQEVGHELAREAAEEACPKSREVVVPKMAVVSCDGGRIRTRLAGRGRGVTLDGGSGWKETKNASFEKMLPAAAEAAGGDPCPQLPDTFRSVKKAANLAEQPLAEAPLPEADESFERAVYRGPKRTLRTVLASMACSDEFGPMMAREAERRGFFDAQRRAFVGDGLAWNWSIWERHFPTFVPILDFIHVLQYLYRAALSLDDEASAAQALYVRHASLCWEGRVDEVIAELSAACRERDVDPSTTLADDHPLKPVTDAVRYLGNNRQRMNYPEYRRRGLPVTSAPMESLVKQINARVKGTEMFWDAPDGAEAILQVRAAALCDDGRLQHYLAHRPGSPFHRRSTTALLAT